jgi:hypothetical protein
MYQYIRAKELVQRSRGEWQRSYIGLVIQAKGDLDGALQYTQRAPPIDEKV